MARQTRASWLRRGWCAALALGLLLAPVHAMQGVSSLFAPTSAQTGAPFKVVFSGTSHPGHTVLFARPGTDAAIPGEFNSNAPLTVSPTTISAPFQPGNYDLVVLAVDGAVLLRLPVTVTPARARLDAPERVTSGTVLAVSWEGPASPADYIVFAEPGAPADLFIGSEVADTTTNPALLRAPARPGTYELRYVQRVLELHMILTRKTVEVQGP